MTLDMHSSPHWNRQVIFMVLKKVKLSRYKLQLKVNTSVFAG